MSEFRKTIDTSKGPAEFEFNRILTGDGPRFDVFVTDRENQLHHFSMQKGFEKWHIMQAPKPADWIVDVQEDLSNAIMKKIEREDSGC